jgi:hypothetical protein
MEKTLLPLEGFTLNLIFEYFPENPLKTLLPLEGFTLNLIFEYFPENPLKIQV